MSTVASAAVALGAAGTAAEVERPLVAVLVGTDHHPFVRLVDASRTLADEGWARWHVQHGDTPWPGDRAGLRGSRLLGLRDLGALLGQADAVVTHGGPGLIMEALEAGHRPVVMGRDPALGEHVDAHQMRFVAHLRDSGRIRPADDVVSLRAQVRSALASGRAPQSLATPDEAVVRRFGDLVAEAVGTGRSRR